MDLILCRIIMKLLEVSLRPGSVGYEFWRDKLVGEVRRYLDEQ